MPVASVGCGSRWSVHGAGGSDEATTADVEKRQRLQALLARWLRMGAGCSCGPKVGGMMLGALEKNVLCLLRKAALGESPAKEAIAALIAKRRVADTSNGNLRSLAIPPWEDCFPLWKQKEYSNR
jgi:hypothetical protein